MRKNCERCGNPFNANPIIQGDIVCNTCERMNCITFWYPKLHSLGFPTPKTIILHTNQPMIKLSYGETPENIDELINEIRAATKRIGTLPIFLRTGYTSNKHEWENSCFIDQKTLDDDQKILAHLRNLVEFSAIAIIDRFMPCDFWAVREFIETESYFNYFGNMPITKERRYFVRNGKIECHHNYWDRRAFKDDIDEKRFKELSSLSEEDEKELERMAAYIADIFHGYWSVDFLKGKDGRWYLTDMAIGERSHHPKCEIIKN